MTRPSLPPTFLVFEFPDANDALDARRRVDAWARAYKLVFEQLAAVVVPAGDSARVVVRLAFSRGEQLSFERWLERVPAEEPFDAADCRIISMGDSDYEVTAASFHRLAAN